MSEVTKGGLKMDREQMIDRLIENHLDAFDPEESLGLRTWEATSHPNFLGQGERDRSENWAKFVHKTRQPLLACFVHV